MLGAMFVNASPSFCHGQHFAGSILGSGEIGEKDGQIRDWSNVIADVTLVSLPLGTVHDLRNQPHPACCIDHQHTYDLDIRSLPLSSVQPARRSPLD
jgi:hypothetical protein